MQPVYIVFKKSYEKTPVLATYRKDLAYTLAQAVNDTNDGTLLGECVSEISCIDDQTSYTAADLIQAAIITTRELQQCDAQQPAAQTSHREIADNPTPPLPFC